MSALPGLPGDVAAHVKGGKLEFRPISATPMKKIKWRWTGRIPNGHLTLVAGREGVGKSTLLALTIAGATRGTLPGDFAAPCRVLVASLEDDTAATLRPRLEAAGADNDMVSEMVPPDGIGLDIHLHLDEIRAEVERSAAAGTPIGMIVFDPVKAASVTTKANDEMDVRALLNPLATLAQRHDLAVVVSAHFKKGGESYAAWNVSGTPAWTQVPRSIVFFDRDPEADPDDTDARVIAHAKVNLGRLAPTIACRLETAVVTLDDGETIETGLLRLGGETAVRAEDLRADDERTKVAEAADWMREYLSDGPVKKAEVLKAGHLEGYSDSTLTRATKKLEVVKRRHGSGPSHYSEWSLPPDTSDASDSSQCSSALDSRQTLDFSLGGRSANPPSQGTPVTPVTPVSPTCTKASEHQDRWHAHPLLDGAMQCPVCATGEELAA